MAVTTAGQAAGRSDLAWVTMSQDGIQAMTRDAGVFEYAPFLPGRLRTARLVQRAGGHLRWDQDGDGVCEGFADGVGPGGAQRWFVILRRSSREETTPEVGHEQVDILEMDWIGRGRPSLVLRGHTPLERVKSRLFVLSLDLDGDGSPDMEIEYWAPRGLAWVVAYHYMDSALRPGIVDLADRWRGRLAFQMVRLFYDVEYFFHHGGTAPAPPIGSWCP